MADVFLSYSSKDRAIATHIEQALTAAGFDVFWDQETPTGRDWNSWIGEKLAIAKVVVVLWSKTSVASRNVVHEATIAVEQGKLIPAVTESLKSTDFPMGFYTVQGADLRGFEGGDHPGMAKLLEAVKRQLGERQARGPAPKRKSKLPLIGGVLAACVALFGLFYVAVQTRVIDLGRDYALYDAVLAGPTNGIASGSDVRFSGINVGEVMSLKLDATDASHVVARLRVTRETPVRASSSVSIESANGSSWVALSSGSPNEPLLGTSDESPARILPPPAAETSEPLPAALLAMAGEWRWAGTQCGQGARISVEKDAVIVEVASSPTYRHAVESVDEGVVRTKLKEPKDEAGERFEFTPKGGTLDVKDMQMNNTIPWEKCP